MLEYEGFKVWRSSVHRGRISITLMLIFLVPGGKGLQFPERYDIIGVNVGDRLT